MARLETVNNENTQVEGNREFFAMTALVAIAVAIIVMIPEIIATMAVLVAVICGIAAYISGMSRLTKLHIIRACADAIMTAVINFPVNVKALLPYRLPMYWLRHYLRGSGEALRVPEEVVKAAHKSLLDAIESCVSGDWQAPDFRHDNRVYGTKYCLYHSTLYEGRGFEGRPTLFYLVGGFTFRLRYDGLVDGKDHYDWHATENGTYFTSPLGTGTVMEFIIEFLGRTFSSDWFVGRNHDESVTGEPGISNKLWEEMKLIGAKEFNSWFKQVDVFTDEEIEKLDKWHKEGYMFEDEDYEDEEDEEEDNSYEDEE